MTCEEKQAEHDAALRQKAEEIVSMSEHAFSAQDQCGLLPHDAERQTLHELIVRQIELEMQNDELRRTQAELAAARARYFDLYDLAPVGYVTLSESGLILEGNLAAANLLGMARAGLVRQSLNRFIFADDIDKFHIMSREITKTGEPRSCELRMVRQDGTIFEAHLRGAAVKAECGNTLINVVIGDYNR